MKENSGTLHGGAVKTEEFGGGFLEDRRAFGGIGDPLIELRPDRAVTHRALELGMRPVAAPEQPFGTEGVAQQWDRSPSDGVADSLGAVAISPGKLQPDPARGAHGQQVAETRVRDAQLGVGTTEVIDDNLDAGRNQWGDDLRQIAGIALHGVCYTFSFITAQVFLDRRVEPGLRGQAQGLLVMVSGGLGPLVGALVCGYLRAHCVTPAGQGWAWFWGILAGMIAGCFVIFALFYQGKLPVSKPARDVKLSP